VIWTPKNGKNKIVKDAIGKVIDSVISFDDETNMAVILVANCDYDNNKHIIVQSDDGNTVLKVKVHLRGCTIEDRVKNE